jgi:hypothetical protein
MYVARMKARSGTARCKLTLIYVQLVFDVDLISQIYAGEVHRQLK